nr:hypothetical protein [Mucilaginibacter sp. SP1R1]
MLTIPLSLTPTFHILNFKINFPAPEFLVDIVIIFHLSKAAQRRDLAKELKKNATHIYFINLKS